MKKKQVQKGPISVGSWALATTPESGGWRQPVGGPLDLFLRTKGTPYKPKW